MYEIRKSNDPRHIGRYEVAHYWDDGVTVQVRYFKTKKEAKEYLKNQRNEKANRRLQRKENSNRSEILYLAWVVLIMSTL